MGKITGSDLIVEMLIEQGTEVVFGYPGGQVLNIYDSLYKYSDKIKHVITAHEQGASHAADGYARKTGKVGVVIATSGPGATNIVTGIATANLDSVPMVAITGNVPCNLLGKDSFQEVDIAGITMPISKHNYIVKDINDLADTIREAFFLARSGRPGPVLIDIPKDVQIAEIEYKKEAPNFHTRHYPVSENSYKKMAHMIEKSYRPYIYCGGGVLSSEACEELKTLAELIDAPVGCSMMGLTAIPYSHPNALGMVGMHGRYASTKTKNDADLIIALGVRFSDRATGKTSEYMKDANIIHIDIDPAELNKNVDSGISIKGDIKEILTELLKYVKKKENPRWWQHINKYRQMEQECMVQTGFGLTPYEIIDELCHFTNEDTVIATDVGQHQMWTAQRYHFEKPYTFLTSGGLGTMGYGMGAAIGSCVADGERTVLITGDGSFGMNLNEMATAVSNQLPLVVIIMNNGVLGMVRQWQTLFYNKHYSQTTLNRQTDFVKLAEAFGGKGKRAYDHKELRDALEEAFHYNGPYIIDCVIDMDEMVLPMIPPGGTMNDVITEVEVK
jgi:acetolactate synthase-1/2/3 large subunit